MTGFPRNEAKLCNVVNDAINDYKGLMLEEGIISEDQFNVMKPYVVTYAPKSYFGKLLDKLRGHLTSKYDYTYLEVVKVLGHIPKDVVKPTKESVDSIKDKHRKSDDGPNYSQEEEQ